METGLKSHKVSKHNSGNDQKVTKLEIETKMTESNKTIYDLNIDCLQDVIEKLSIEEIFKIEKVDQRFEYRVKEVLKQKTVIRFSYYYQSFKCKYSVNNSKLKIYKYSNEVNVRLILENFRNIRCLQLGGIVTNRSLFEWISIHFKRLDCLHLYRPKSYSDSPQLEFKEIGKLLSDKIEIEIIFDKKEDSIIALLKNMPQIKDIGFDSNHISIKAVRREKKSEPNRTAIRRPSNRTDPRTAYPLSEPNRTEPQKI